MSKITEVVPQKKTFRLPSTSLRTSRSGYKRFNIFIDGQFAFGADEDLVVEHRLVMGKEISAEELEKLLFEAEVGKLMERMYGLFNIRQRSEKEVRDKLRIKNYELKILGKEETSDLAIELVIKKLKQKGLLNDEKFAKAWTEARRKKKGLKVIKQELFQKGIDRKIIEKIINQESNSGDGTQVAEKLLEKKMKIWKNLPVLEFRKKAYDFLLRRGFEYEVVRKIVENMLEKR